MPSARTAAPFSNCRRAALLPVTIYSAEPDLLRPIFNAIPGIQASFLPVSSYKPDARRRHRFAGSFCAAFAACSAKHLAGAAGR